MSEPPQATKRWGGWGALVRALPILAVLGVALLWLRGPGEIDPRLSATPYVELELPPPGAAPQPAEAAARTPDEIRSPASADGEPEAAMPAVTPRQTGAGDPPATTPDQQPEPAPAAAVVRAENAPERTTAMEPPPAPKPPVPELALPTPMVSGSDMARQPARPAAPLREEPTAEAPAPEAPAEETPVTGSAAGSSVAEAPATDSPAEEPRTSGHGSSGPFPSMPPVAGAPPAGPAAPEPPAAAGETAPTSGPAQSPQLAAAGVTGAAVARPAWRRFARPFPADDPRPRIAIIVAELGFSESATRAAIERLPAAVTLSFTPYGQRLQEWIDTARADGHEVMLDLPMEPVSYPRDDPGPKALFTALSASENQARLEWMLDRAEGYVGVVPWMGSRFTTSAEDMRPILGHIDAQGLMFVDARPSPDSIAARLADEIGVPRAVNTRFLDHVPSRDAIEGRLRQIEREARTTGFAVGMASPYPITIEILDRWVRTLNRKGLALAPISALAGRQADP